MNCTCFLTIFSTHAPAKNRNCLKKTRIFVPLLISPERSRCVSARCTDDHSQIPRCTCRRRSPLTRTLSEINSAEYSTTPNYLVIEVSQLVLMVSKQACGAKNGRADFWSELVLRHPMPESWMVMVEFVVSKMISIDVFLHQCWIRNGSFRGRWRNSQCAVQQAELVDGGFEGERSLTWVFET